MMKKALAFTKKNALLIFLTIVVIVQNVGAFARPAQAPVPQQAAEVQQQTVPAAAWPTPTPSPLVNFFALVMRADNAPRGLGDLQNMLRRYKWPGGTHDSGECLGSKCLVIGRYHGSPYECLEYASPGWMTVFHCRPKTLTNSLDLVYQGAFFVLNRNLKRGMESFDFFGKYESELVVELTTPME